MLMTQLYISTKHSTQLPPGPIVNCLQELKIWMTSNLLKLNSNTTELMVVAPNSLPRKVGDLLLEVDGCSITRSPQPGCHPGPNTIIPVPHLERHKICILPPEEHRTTPIKRPLKP